MDPLRIFISSPGDVADECELARKLIEDRLRIDPSLRCRVSLQAFTWNNPNAPAPMLGQMTPQKAVNRHLPEPSQCHIVIVVLWSRMGTPLPPEMRKPDGKPYASGTEWEYENALKGKATSCYFH
jgi:hypothetical protein